MYNMFRTFTQEIYYITKKRSEILLCAGWTAQWITHDIHHHFNPQPKKPHIINKNLWQVGNKCAFVGKREDVLCLCSLELKTSFCLLQRTATRIETGLCWTGLSWVIEYVKKISSITVICEWIVPWMIYGFKRSCSIVDNVMYIAEMSVGVDLRTLYYQMQGNGLAFLLQRPCVVSGILYANYDWVHFKGYKCQIDV